MLPAETQVDKSMMRNTVPVTGPNGTVPKSLANRLMGLHLGTGFNPESGFKALWVGVRPLHPLLSH